MMPAVPLPALWGFLCGVILIVCGSVPAGEQICAQCGVACGGAVMAVLT